jgi:nicotinate dehydrogenase subunit B
MIRTELSGPLTRRAFLAAGALTVSFTLIPRALAATSKAPPGNDSETGNVKTSHWLDAWIQVAADGHVTVFTGKVELGQGVRTALIQVAAEELDIRPAAIELITADTWRTPDEGLTAGSHSLQESGTAIQRAAACVRWLLTEGAAKSWNVAPETVTTTGDGHLRSSDGRVESYGAMAKTLSLHVEVNPTAPLRDPAQFRTMGKELPRVDIPAKLTGGNAFLQDIRLPGMLHARVVRGPSYGTRLMPVDVASVQARPGVVKVVQSGNFVAVVAENEWVAILAQRELQKSAYIATLPQPPTADVVEKLRSLPAQDISVLNTQNPVAQSVCTVKARYTRPWLSHGSIGPSCAVALFEKDVMTVYTHSQGAFNVQSVVAELLGLILEKVHVIHREGAGCYGQNGADDAAAEAAFLANALPGRPIRLQWMREQEFGWEPLGPGMVTELEASLDTQNRIVSWRHEIWSNRHNDRPVTAGGTLVGQEVEPPFPPQKGKPIPMPEGDADRNSNPLYALPNMHVVFHYLPDMLTRCSSLRSLGAHLNVLSIESMFDELAKAAGVDPLTLRLAHMEDERARAVMEAATTRFGWSKRSRGNGRRGCGMAFARYKNEGAYCAIAMEVEVNRETGRVAVRRAVVAVDSGQAVNPDGIRNQIEGGFIQSLSWTSREAATFDAEKRTSFDWSMYPILRFPDVPDSIEIHIINRPGMPFLGSAEAAQGPTAAAFANAVADAIGTRLRDLPLSPERVKAAVGVT